MRPLIAMLAFLLPLIPGQAQTTARYRLKELGSGLYFVTDGAYNTMFLVGSKGIIVVDPLPTLGPEYLSAIRSVSDKPIRYIVYSHSHTDHIGGSRLFPADAKVIAQRQVAERLKEEADPRRRLPDVVFDKDYTVSVGDQHLELHYPGPNHEIGNILIWAPKQKVLMLVDVIYPGYMPYKNLGDVEDTLGYIKAHEWALQYPFQSFVGGHVGDLGTKHDVETSFEFARDLKKTAAAVLTATTFPQYMKDNPGADGWDAHKRYEDVLTQQIYAQLFPRWKNRLKDADTYLKDNCWAMMEALIIQLPPAE